MQRSLAGGFPIWVVMLGAPGCVLAPTYGGPLPVRNQHPAQLAVLHLPPASAAALASGTATARLDAAYSSLFLLGSGGGQSWRMDGEYLRVGTTVRVGVGSGMELAAEVPFAHTSGGFLDNFLVDYHELLGFPDQGRDDSVKDAFSIAARRNGQTVWSVDQDSAELLDVPLYASLQLRAPGQERLGIAARVGIELPTGDEDRGYGSGDIEPGLGVVLEYWCLGVALYGHAQHTWAATPRPARANGLEFADVTALGLGAELPLADDLHAFLQVEGETSALRNFGLPVTDRNQVLLWVGGRWQLATAVGIEIGFGEDLQGLASPDFTAWLGVVWNPLAGAGTRATGLPR